MKKTDGHAGRKCISGEKDACMHAWVHGYMNKWVAKVMDRQISRLRDKLMDRWAGGWVSFC